MVMNHIRQQIHVLKNQLGIANDVDTASLNLLRSILYLMGDVRDQHVVKSDHGILDIIEKVLRKNSIQNTFLNQKLDELSRLEDEINSIHLEATSNSELSFDNLQIPSLEKVANSPDLFQWSLSNIQDLIVRDCLNQLIEHKERVISSLTKQDMLVSLFMDELKTIQDFFKSNYANEKSEELDDLYLFSFKVESHTINDQMRWDALTEGLKKHEVLALKQFQERLLHVISLNCNCIQN